MSGSLFGSPAHTFATVAHNRSVSTARPAPMRSHNAAAAAAAAAATSWADTSPVAPPAAYVYCGPGAGTRSVLSTLHSLREALVPAVKVASLDTSALLAGDWQPGCLLLVMPGGADLPYCKHLNGRGNQLIREYVEGGGSYLGLCAGAYYACARVEFEPGTRLEVVGDRELAFFPGAAVGSIYRGFQYESEAGAVAAPLRFRRQHGVADAAGAQAGAANPGSGQGSAGGSSGGSSEGLWELCTDYVNGGPGFRMLDGSPLPPLLPALAAQGKRGQQQHAAQHDKLQQQAAQQQEHVQGLGNVEVLATYPEHGNAAAAVLCRVGSRGGRAVLCSSHPELHPSWLAGEAPPQMSPGAGGSSNGSGGSSSSSSSPTNGSKQRAVPAGALASTAAGDSGGTSPAFVDSVTNRAAAASALAARLSTEGHVQRLQATLLAAAPQRQRFWRSLLAAAGLGPWDRQTLI